MNKSYSCPSKIRLFRSKLNCAKALCQIAIVAAAAVLLPGQTQGQASNWLYFPFTDPPGSNTTVSSTSLGGLGGVVLTGYSATGVPSDFHGAVGSGVNGAFDGARALCLTNGEGGTQPGNATTPPTGASAANCVADLADPLLANTITNFIVSMWFNQPVKAPSGGGFVLPRLFVLSPSGGNDGSANSIGVKFQQENEFIFSIGATTLTTAFGPGSPPTNYPAGDFTTNTWYFVAWAYDGTNISQYTGSATSPTVLVNQVSAPGLKVALGSAPYLVIGNRNYEGARGFDGWIQNFRIDTGVPANPTNYLESVRESSPGIILSGNFIDDSINTDYGGGNAPAPSAMSGAAAIGAAGDKWNGLTASSYGGYPNDAHYTNASGTLSYSDGNLSPVTLSVYGPGGTFDNNAINWGSTSPFSWSSLAAEDAGTGYPNTPYAALMAVALSSYNNAADGYGSLNFGGLSPNGTYNLYLYSAGNAAGRTSTFTVGGNTQTSTYDDVTTNLVSGVDYVEFAGVTADANGNLDVTFGNGNSECDLDGFQLQFVSGTPPPPPLGLPPTMSYTSNLNALTMCTNTSVEFTAQSAANNIAGFSVTVVTSQLTSPLVTTNNATFNANGAFGGTNVVGLNSGSATLTLPLTTNLHYSISVTALDNKGQSIKAALAFDTYAPALVIEASDYNYNGGQYLDTPANGGVWLYNTLSYYAVSGVDFYKSGGEGPNALFYRDQFSGAPYVTEANPDTVSEQKNTVASTGTTNGVNDFPELAIGYTTVGDWFNYTRTFGSSGYPTDSAPAGTYNVWLFMAVQGSGAEAKLSLVSPSPATTSDQTLTPLGQFGTVSFAENDWNGFEYVPLTDSYGNLLSVTIGSGVQTFQLSQGPNENPNLGFLMFLPAATVRPPAFSSLYPDGVHPFEATNHFTFTVDATNGSTILSSGIGLTLNGTNVTSGLTLVQNSSGWVGSYPVKSNAVYSAVITATNTAGLFNSLVVNFDTFNVNNYQWEAIDYDFSTNDNNSTPPQQGAESGPGWYSGLFIDNPIPTADVVGTSPGPAGTEATNSYFGYPGGWTSSIDPYGAGAIAQQGIDVNFAAAGQTVGTSPGGYEQYRWADGVGAQVSTDYLRPKFLAAQQALGDANIGLFNLCYVSAGDWLNYTRHYPAGGWYVWARMANSANYSNSFSVVTNGVGTPVQSSSVLGTFTDNNATGYQAWHWIPLLNSNGSPAVVYTTGQATTFKSTALDGQNIEFFMLAPAPPAFTVTASIVAGQLSLAFPTEAGHNYTLMYESSLTSPPNWTPVGSAIAGTGSTVTVTKPLTGTQGYYSVVVQ